MTRKTVKVISAVIVGLIGAYIALDYWLEAGLEWTIDSTKDPMSDQVKMRAYADFESVDNEKFGEMEFTCTSDFIVLNFDVSDDSFKAGQPIKYRLGDHPYQKTVSMSEYSNKITLYIDYNSRTANDPSSSDPYSSEQVSRLMSQSYNLLFSGKPFTVQDILSANSLLVELPMDDGSEPVVKIDTTDPTLRRFFDACLKIRAATR